jgi:hypothetical protein
MKRPFVPLLTLLASAYLCDCSDVQERSHIVGVRTGTPLTASVGDTVSVHFLRDKIEESRLKCLWQQTASTQRWRRGGYWKPCLFKLHRAKGRSPWTLALAVCCTVSSVCSNAAG